jgi:hypothetical protein
MKSFDNEWIFETLAASPSFFDSTDDDFTSTMEGVARRIARNDERFGIAPRNPRTRRCR